MPNQYQVNRIDDFLSEHGEAADELITYIRDRQEDLVRVHGYRKIFDIEDACRMHVNSDDETTARKAIEKISKKDIFEICARVAFLDGLRMAYAWFERTDIRFWPYKIALKAGLIKNPYQRREVHCEVCDETQYGTVVNITPPFQICDVCLTMMDRVIATEVIGDEDRQSTKNPDSCSQIPTGT